MLVGLLEVDIKIFESSSLKEKRSVVKSIIRRLDNLFNISISEVSNLDKINYSTIGIAIVSNNKKIIQSTFEKVVDYIDNDQRCEIINISSEII